MSQVNVTLFQQIEQLNKDAWAHRLNDAPKLIELAEKALKISKSIGCEKGEAEALRAIGFYFMRTAEHDQALVYFDQALEIFQKIENLAGEAQVCQCLGVVQRRIGNYEKAMMLLLKALQIQTREGFRQDESLSLYDISVTYKYLGNLDQALEYLLQALQLARNNQYQLTEAYALNHLGAIYADMGDCINALEYYKQSLHLRRLLHDKWGEADCLNRLGLIYSKLNDFETAVEYCLESLATAQAIGDKKGTGDSLYHLGSIYQEMGKKESACTYVNQSLQIRSELADKRGQVESLLLFIDLFFSTDLDAKESLLNQANSIAQEILAKDLLLDIHNVQYKFYKKSGQFEKSLFHLEKQLQYEKELYTQTINQKLTNQKINHQIEQSKKEAENLAIKAELKLLTDRQRIARDLHDDVGSTLSSISILSESYLRSGHIEADKSRFGDLGDKARTALESISDIVWSVNPDNDSMEKLLARMSAFASEMLENAGAELLFQVGENIESMALPMEKRKDFYLIFKEAIHNCAKYAQAKHIEIRLEVKNNTLHLSIKDDGIGFDPSKVENLGMGGNGLKNMQRRTAVIGGVFSIQSNPGYGVTLSVAVPLVP